MKLEWNFDAKDLMKRTSRPVQGFKPHSGMSTLSVRSRGKTEGGLFPTYILYVLEYKSLKREINTIGYGTK